ncbi:Ig-like domain-containing protein [Gracilibacillus saliphilus]|uniref:Ig-like domain-containing protein n=1 Tax=Gracilibacillus saliphilus TaxID=543890 RepID=UPI0013D121A2|nr:Ig-like domain-containing protein [Gracilibacillus saliphilus]
MLCIKGLHALRKSLHPNEPELTGIDAEPASMSVVVGNTDNITVTANYDDQTTDDVTAESTYESDNESVATVDGSGQVTAVAEGTAQITVTYEGQTDTVDVTVTAE